MELDAKGKIKLADNVLESLKESNDIKSGGGLDFMYPDPVRVFRQHYGDDAFDLIPDLEKFGMGPSGYGTCMLQKSHGDLLFLKGIFYGTSTKQLVFRRFLQYLLPNLES